MNTTLTLHTVCGHVATVWEGSVHEAEDTGHTLVLAVSTGWAEVLMTHAVVELHTAAVACNPAAQHLQVNYIYVRNCNSRPQHYE